MKLFDYFEAVKFPEENLILVFHGSILSYVYNVEFKSWDNYQGFKLLSLLTVENYPDVSKSEIMDAMGGVFPNKETDFLRLIKLSELTIRDMMALLCEDFPDYMLNHEIRDTVDAFLDKSDIPHKSYVRLRKLFGDAKSCKQDENETVRQIKDLSLFVIGRDIFKKEIGIVDGHDSSSYFWFRPVRVTDSTNTNDWDTVAEMQGVEISIEQDDVAQYLTPFLYKYFDGELYANRKRIYEDDDAKTNAEGETEQAYTSDFEWDLTHNFYTYDAFSKILADIRETIDALSEGVETEYTRELRVKRGSATHQLIYAKGLSDEQIKAYNASRPKVDDTEPELIIDFYQRFLYRLEYMIRVGKEKGYNLISVMGP